MASKPRKRKEEYSDLEKELDIEAFTDSVLKFFSGVPDPRQGYNQTYKLEHIFFIILSAMLAGANSINQIAIFSNSKAQWIKGLRSQILAIDGKRLCGTQSDVMFNPFLHIVSLFSVNTGIILAQQPVDSKSNEITAIPKILEGVDIQGAVITSDAMGCQKDIAKKICDKGADYVLALKGNTGLYI